MIVKNYIVENYREFIGELEKELCQKGISYVRIDNEIHFLDKIFRFFDFDINRHVIYIWFSMIEEKKRQNGLIHLEKYLVDSNMIEDGYNFYDQYLHKEQSHYQFNKYQSRNKKIQKSESNNVNQKLKKYKI